LRTTELGQVEATRPLDASAGAGLLALAAALTRRFAMTRSASRAQPTWVTLNHCIRFQNDYCGGAQSLEAIHYQTYWGGNGDCTQTSWDGDTRSRREGYRCSLVSTP
jgi:hypothetical protein